VPVVGDLDEMVTSVRRGGYRIVVVVPDPAWTRRRLRDMAWELEGTPAALIVAPALMEVTGPRLHMTPVYGLTLLRVSKPSFTGVRWLLKDAIERISALAGLVVLTPLLLMIALAIKRDDGGPVLFRQERVGRAGKTFMMLKFRSMGVDAEHQLGALETGNEGAGPLFKLRHDPRVTRVGALMRRYSLDELPQLLNVVRGHMSLVGPRPPLPREVLLYATDAMRRLLVKPGLTGLWQISGRSDLSWEEAIRLDLRYVENWSFALDAMILWKTIAAVLRPTGAY
jgi:exopolysaccharide biosynthesis polyprenyl glycosylphosphotransferase